MIFNLPDVLFPLCDAPGAALIGLIFTWLNQIIILRNKQRRRLFKEFRTI